MNTETVRLNITIPKEVACQLKDITESRKRSQFITEAIKKKIEEEKKAKMDQLLEEGYQVMSQESLSLTNEFQDVDVEGWDEY